MTTVTDQLRSLSERLGLEYEEQDWGIVNADGQRLNEFIAIYDSPTLSKEMKFQVFELIVASANEALHDERIKLVIQDFVQRHGKDFPEQVAYWAGLRDLEEFPVAEILQKFL